MDGRRLARGLIAASVLLFWLQALRTAFSTLFGIIYDQIFVGPASSWLAVSNLLLFLTFLGPLALGGRGPAWLWRLAPVVAALGRVGLSLPDPSLRYWSSLLVLAAGSGFLAGALRGDRRGVAIGLGLALCLDQLLRAVGHTFDLSFQSDWLALPLAWSALLLSAAIWTWRGPDPTGRHGEPAGAGPAGRQEGQPGRPPGPEDASSRQLLEQPGRPPGWLAGLAFGGWLFLETSLLSVPNAAAGWSGWHYAVLSPGLLIATFAPLAWAYGPAASRFWRYVRYAGALLPLGLLIGYFASGPGAAAALLLAQAAAMLALVSWMDPAVGLRAGWLAAGGLLALLANYLNAFTFTYPYTLPQMRGLGWLVYLLATAPVALCLLASRSHPERAATPAGWRLAAWAAAGTSVLLSAWMARPIGADPLPQGSLVLASYNIHYGYDDPWHFTLEEQARELELQRADLVALQEVDAGRITSYLVDDAFYLARRLNMNVAYLPTVEHLTGIAVLYKGEAAAVRRRLLTSLLEQTGVVGVELPLGETTFSAFGVWIGLEDEDTLTQVREALDFIGQASPAVLAGDFNAVETDPRIQAIRQAGFADPFELLGLLPAPTDPAENPIERVDYVWLRGMAPVRARVADSLASDHRLVVVETRPIP